MKLLQCLCCGDVVRIYSEARACQCGCSTGKYVSDTHVKLTGPSRAIGIDTGELRGTAGTWHVSARTVRT